MTDLNDPWRVGELAAKVDRLERRVNHLQWELTGALMLIMATLWLVLWMVNQ